MDSGVVQCPKGIFYMKVEDCGILPLTIAINHVQLSQFPGEPDQFYMSFDTAIEWHTKNPGRDTDADEDTFASLLTTLHERLKSGDGIHTIGDKQ